jgi:cell wall-active antibiotic response 4TMS protein YvqF
MRSKIGAWILIVLGAVFLAANLGWIPRLGPLLAVWWPAILIAVGVWILLKR